MRRRSPFPVGVAIGSLWFASVAAGFVALTIHANTPGVGADPGPNWPAKSTIPLKNGKAALLVFVHPECPCSKATVGELSRLLPRLEGRVDVFVILATSDKFSSVAQMQSRLELQLARDQVRIVKDEGNAESSLFGVRTSGQVLLYNSSHRLTFRGGITPSRAHMGDSDGRRAIISYVSANFNGEKEASLSHVFGCALPSKDRLVAKEKE